MIFDKVQRILIGLKSASDNGNEILGIGVIKASFHLSGNILVSKEMLIICVNTSLIRSIKSFNTKAFIPSAPVEFV